MAERVLRHDHAADRRARAQPGLAQHEAARARLEPGSDVPPTGAHVWLKVTGAHTCYYGRDEALIASADSIAEGQP